MDIICGEKQGRSNFQFLLIVCQYNDFSKFTKSSLCSKYDWIDVRNDTLEGGWELNP